MNTVHTPGAEDFAGRIAKLASAPPAVFWQESFRRSAYTKHKPLEAVRDLGAKAEACGRQYGRQARAEGKRPRALCEESGLEIREFAMPPSPGLEIFALFEPPASVFIRKDLCDRCDRFIRSSGMDAFLGEFCCFDILLAHEFFHFLEERDCGTIFTRAYREPRGLFGRKAELPPLAEVAAMAFAQELLGLEWTPFLLDSIMLYPDDAPSALAIVERLERFAAEA